MAVPVRLKVFKGEELIATRDFERDMIKIGRLATAHLCVEDEKVSRIHSVINVEGDGKLSIVDMGSVEGTYLNGKRVNKGSVQFGDEIRIGNTRITVEKPAGAPAEEGPVAQGSSEITAVAVLSQITEQNTIPAPAPAPAPMAEAPRAPPAPGFSAATAITIPPVSAVKAVPPPPPVMTLAAEELQEQDEEELSAAEDVWEGMVQEGRHRKFRLHVKPFDTFVAEKPSPRRVESSEKLGLQIRYYWGDTLLQVSQHAEPKNIFVGNTSRCDLKVESDRTAEYALVRKNGDAFELNVGEGMSGELDRDGHVKKLAAGGHEIRPTDFAWVDMGGVRAELSFAVQPKKIVIPLSDSIDYGFLNMFLLMFLVMGGFVITATTRTDVDVVADDISMNKLLVTKFIIKEAEKPKKNALLEKLEASKEAKKSPGEMAEKHKDTEGKMGKLEAPESKTKRSAPKAIDINAKDLVKNSGILKSLGSAGGGGLSTIFGQGGLGGDLKGALGNMFGSQVGDAKGFGGLGLKGTGTGGGGTGNTIGIGGIGTKGRGGGLGSYGNGIGGLGGTKKMTDPTISDGDSVVQGSLDKELIRKVIRDNIQKIRYCYEKELQVKPNLAGKVSVRFVIAQNGDVQVAKVAEGSTINDGGLGECITTRVRTFKFPSPKGGGNVIVTYPFVFKQSGE